MNNSDRRAALADFLRTRRARLQPADVGLPSAGRRRTPGLRREEVAALAHVGLSWYTLLEQAQDVNPSRQVLTSLADALRLTPAERRHLFTLALPEWGQAREEDDRAAAPAEETISPALRRMVNALDPNPVYVIGRRWDLLAWNQAAEAVFHFSTIAPPHTCNLVWRVFTTPELMSDRAYWEVVARRFVERFRADYARYPGDPWFGQLIADLQATDTPFREWWAQHDVREPSEPGLKAAQHPRLGRLDFERVTLQVPDDPGLKVIIHTASPDTAARLPHLLDPDPGD